MIFLLIAVILTIFIGIKFRKKDDVDNYLDKECTSSITGLFAVLILFKHFHTYPDLSLYNQFDIIGMNITSYLGQLVVVPFLFFSGYGLYEQIKRRGDKYINSLPKNRVFKVYLMFLLAWVVFFILSFVIKANYNVPHYILSFFAITSIGNSNWYIVVILVLYLSTYLSFKFIKDHRIALITNIALGLMMYFILKSRSDLDSSWWNTIVAYLAGLTYSFFKDKILSIYKAHNWTRVVFLLISVALTALFGIFSFIFNSDLSFALMVIFFGTIFPCLFALFKISNKFLLLLGKYSFWIYILQRIPMIIFSYVPAIKNIVYLYFALCVVITAILAFGFDKLFNLIWSKISKK